MTISGVDCIYVLFESFKLEASCVGIFVDQGGGGGGISRGATFSKIEFSTVWVYDTTIETRLYK